MILTRCFIRDLLGSGPINYVYPAPVKFLMDGSKNCAGHSDSYVQAIFTIRHKNLPRPAGFKITGHLLRQARTSDAPASQNLAFLASTL
jgi:hypothetical protein